MPITINGTGTITGISAGGLPDAIITQPELATGVSGTGPAFSAQITTTQTITANANTKVIFGTEYFDTNSNYDVANGRFTPTVAGYYQINSQIYFPSNSSSYATTEIQKNGTAIAVAASASQTYVAVCPSVSTIVYLNGTTDYVESFAATGQSGTLNLTSSSRFSGALVRAA
jgi:hypothetical protein